MEEVSEVEELISIVWNQTFDSSKLRILHKTLKAAKLVIADRVILSRTNTELYTANMQKKIELNRLIFNKIVKILEF